MTPNSLQTKTKHLWLKRLKSDLIQNEGKYKTFLIIKFKIKDLLFTIRTKTLQKPSTVTISTLRSSTCYFIKAKSGSHLKINLK